MNLHLGAEIEFWGDSYSGDGAIREYYPGQYEVNDFHVFSKTLEKNLEKLFKWAGVVKQRSNHGQISFTSAFGGSGGPIFSGVHLHLQVRGNRQRDRHMSTTQKIDLASKLSTIVMADVIRYHGLTFRGLTSHHLHGRHRSSEYRYKSKDRFSPVIYNRNFDTFELRCIEPVMLYTDEGRAALQSILKRAYNYLLGKEVRVEKKWKKVVHKLHQLPGDIRYSNQLQLYKDYSDWLKREGVQLEYTFATREDRYSVTYRELAAHRNKLKESEQTYTSDIRSSRRPEWQRFSGTAPIAVNALPPERPHGLNINHYYTHFLEWAIKYKVAHPPCREEGEHGLTYANRLVRFRKAILNNIAEHAEGLPAKRPDDTIDSYYTHLYTYAQAHRIPAPQRRSHHQSASRYVQMLDIYRQTLQSVNLIQAHYPAQESDEPYTSYLNRMRQYEERYRRPNRPQQRLDERGSDFQIRLQTYKVIRRDVQRIREDMIRPRTESIQSVAMPRAARIPIGNYQDIAERLRNGPPMETPDNTPDAELDQLLGDFNASTTDT